MYKRLQVELQGFLRRVIDLEHEVQWIIQEQERNGWLLDQRLCHTLCAKFKERMYAIEEDLQALFPPIVEERYSEKTGKRLKDKVTVFNVGSRQQVAERLTAKGAVWTELTPTGKPMVDEKTLRGESSCTRSGTSLGVPLAPEAIRTSQLLDRTRTGRWQSTR